MFAIASGAPGPAGLAQSGPNFPVLVSGPGGSAVYTAQVDDGSDISSVDQPILAGLGCVQVGTVSIETVNGTSPDPLYAAGLATLGGVDLAGSLPGLLGDSLPAGGPRVLIGRDILARFSFTYDGSGGTWSLGAAGGAGTTGPNPWVIGIVAGAVGTVAGGLILWSAEAAHRRVTARSGTPAYLRQAPGSPADRYRALVARVQAERDDYFKTGDKRGLDRARRALERWQADYGAYAPVGPGDRRYD